MFRSGWLLCGRRIGPTGGQRHEQQGGEEGGGVFAYGLFHGVFT
jgi:hypothetical protein